MIVVDECPFPMDEEPASGNVVEKAWQRPVLSVDTTSEVQSKRVFDVYKDMVEGKIWRSLDDSLKAYAKRGFVPGSLDALVRQDGCPFAAMVMYLRKNPTELDSLLAACLINCGKGQAAITGMAFTLHFLCHAVDYEKVLTKATSPVAKRMKALISDILVLEASK